MSYFHPFSFDDTSRYSENGPSGICGVLSASVFTGGRRAGGGRGEAVGAAGFLGVPGWDWVFGRDCEEPGEGVFAAGDSFLGRVGRLGLGLKSVGAPFFAISLVV